MPDLIAWLRRNFDLSDLSFVYGALCAASLVLIDPWGTPRGEIWTDPKVYAFIALTLLTWGVLLVTFVVERLRRRSAPLRAPASWGWAALLWAAFLGSTLLTIYYSPIKARNALMANNEMGDGLVYWVWVAAFTLGNALVLRRFPQLFRGQLYGFLSAGVLMGLAASVQTFDWRLDFTATMGREVPTPAPRTPNYLYSTIYEGQMPIGLTSHRGHAAFVLAAAATLALVGLLRGWLRGRYAGPLYVFFLLGVYLTSTRGAQLAFLAGMIYLLIRFGRAAGARRTVLLAFVPLVLGAAGLVGAWAVGVPSVTRSLPSLNMLIQNPDAFLSMRPGYWRIAVDGIRKRPLLGWGYNGFGLAFPYVNDFENRFKIYLAWEGGKPVPMEALQGTDHYYFRYVGEDGLIYRGRVMSNKAHNLFLDTAVSFGLVGLGLYLLLLGVFLWVTAWGAGWGLEVVLVVYLVYSLTWFESAQFSHLAWWALSVGLAGQRLPQGVAQRRPFDRSFTAEAG